MAAIAADDDRPQRGGRTQRVERGDEAVDEVTVVGVVDLGPVESDAGDAACIDAPKNRAGRIRGLSAIVGGRSIRSGADSADFQ